MIRLETISKVFNKSHPNPTRALQELDLEVAPQEFLILVGANGSGKSTLLNAIAGSFRVDEGHIFLDQHEVTRLKDFQRSRWIARIFQNPLSGTAPDLSILDNFRLASLRTRPKGLNVGIKRSFRDEVRNKIALLNMGLEDKLEQTMGTLSGGQRQALTLIMAIMDQSRILLLDEPSAALDPKSAKNLMQNIDMIVREFQLTTVLVTHDLKDAHTYGNRIVQMQEGKVIRDLSSPEKAALAREELYEWFA